MMMISSIVAGDYIGCGISNGQSLFHGPTGLELTTKPAVTGKEMGIEISKYTVNSIEDVGSESKNSVAASLFGSVLFGPAGLLLGSNNNRHIVAIYWKDGKKSLADLNDIDYRELKKAMFLRLSAKYVSMA